MFLPDAELSYFCANMASKTRVAVLASRFPYPTEKGDKLRLYFQLKYLATDFDVYLFALSESGISSEDKEEIRQYCKEIFVYEEPESHRRYRVMRNFFDPLPSQVHYFYSIEIRTRFLKDFFRINADVVFCQLYRMSRYLQGIQVPKVLDVMDSFATIAQLQAANARYFYERWFWRKEHRMIQRYESQLMDPFHHYTVISERDAELLQLPAEVPVTIIRNGIDVEYFQSYPNKEMKPAYDMAFIGNMEYKPNIEAVRYIREQLLPYFDENNVKAKFMIGGKGASRLENQFPNHPGLVFHDWYEDIRDAYYDARMFIAPLFLGSGMQNKVLEAMASNRPVVCSSHVIAAMPMLAPYVRVADHPEVYLHHYKQLSDNPFSEEKQNQIFTVLKNELTWESQVEKLKKILNDIGTNYEWNFTRYH